jgi:hypothetical protein
MIQHRQCAHRYAADHEQEQAADQSEVLQEIPEMASPFSGIGPEVRVVPERVI